jgi:hypothetical protein
MYLHCSELGKSHDGSFDQPRLVAICRKSGALWRLWAHTRVYEFHFFPLPGMWGQEPRRARDWRGCTLLFHNSLPTARGDRCYETKVPAVAQCGGGCGVKGRNHMPWMTGEPTGSQGTLTLRPAIAVKELRGLSHRTNWSEPGHVGSQGPCCVHMSDYPVPIKLLRAINCASSFQRLHIRSVSITSLSLN